MSDSIQDIIESLSSVATCLDAPDAINGGRGVKTFRADIVKNALKTLQEAVSKLAKVVEKDHVKQDDLAKVVEKQDELAKVVEEEHVKQDDLKDQLRKHEDEIDNQKQKNMKGTIVITSVQKGNTPSLIKTDDTLDAENISLQKHVSQLILDKYGITIGTEDISFPMVRLWCLSGHVVLHSSTWLLKSRAGLTWA